VVAAATSSRTKGFGAKGERLGPVKIGMHVIFEFFEAFDLISADLFLRHQ